MHDERQTALPAAADNAAPQEMNGDLIALDFGVHVSMRYHAKRRAWFDALHRVAMVVAAVGGSAALATILGQQVQYAAWIAFVVAAAGAFDVAFSPAEKARKVDDLYRRFCDLAAEIAATADPPPDQIRLWKAKKLKIEADEPTAIDTLNVLCHNQEAEARGYGPEHRHRVRWWQSATAQLFTLPPNRFEPLA